LLIEEKESNQELKKLLKLEREKCEKHDLELAQSKETISSLKSSSGALQDSYDVLQKTHKDLEMQFDAIWSSTFKPSNNHEASISQVSVETCGEVVAQENDHLQLEVKRLEQLVSELVKQTKVQPSQDNCINMVNKLEKGSTATRHVFQQSYKAQPHKKQQKTIEYEKIEYARRPHIKNDIGYKVRDKHNSKLNNNGKELMKFTKVNPHQVKQHNKATNHVSCASKFNANASHITYAFDASYVLLRN
jgi:hypothetical protein